MKGEQTKINRITNYQSLVKMTRTFLIRDTLILRMLSMVHTSPTINMIPKTIHVKAIQTLIHCWRSTPLRCYQF
jgi:hypothetical protein